MAGTRVWSRGFSDCGLLSSGIFVHGLEKVNKKSKFLYDLRLSTDIVSLKSSVLAKELRGNTEVRDSEPLLFHREERKGPNANF